MIIDVTSANSPYSLPASLFNPQIPQIPNITLRFSGGGMVQVILPRVADLTVQQGTFDAIMMDAITSVTLQCSGTDIFSGVKHVAGLQTIVANAGPNIELVTGSFEASTVTHPATGKNTWQVKRGFS